MSIAGQWIARSVSRGASFSSLVPALVTSKASALVVSAVFSLMCAATSGAFVVAGAQSAPATAPSETSASRTLIEGFGVSYIAPAHWTLSGREGRIHAWTNAAQTSALVFYAGHFAPLQESLGDAQRVLGVPRDEDTRIIAPLAATQFGAHAGMRGSVGVTGDRAVVAHVAVVQLDDSTVLGAVALLEASSSPSQLDSAVSMVSAVLSGATVASRGADAALRERLTGRWEMKSETSSGQAGGTISNEESWDFAPDGTFRNQKRLAVNVPGAEVTPEERDDRGQWYAVGGAIVLVTPASRLTVDVQFIDGALLLDGTTFTKR